MEAFDAVIVGSGLSGSVIGRLLAERNKKVLILERRKHIGGNLFDFVNDQGILVHKYGPHTFHTSKKELFEFMCKYGAWKEYKLFCGAEIDGRYTPTPFNFRTIDDFFEKEKAKQIKDAIKEAYPYQRSATILELLENPNVFIREYAMFLFEKDYSLYTAKQWGISPKEIDSSVLKRVPVRFNYEEGYFDDEFQYIPEVSYTAFFEKLLEHENIKVRCNVDALQLLNFDDQNNQILAEGKLYTGKVIYTGAIDELFSCCYGKLPYRSLRFEWKTEKKQSFQNAAVVAYPQAEGFTRITEYTKLPIQDVGEVTAYAVEYPIPYDTFGKRGPYYPVLTKESQELYQKYKKKCEGFKNLYLCGRLADFKYYNMDQALEHAMEVFSKMIL